MTHKMTRAVARTLPDLELAMFQNWDERERWAEIRRLTQEQVADDTDTAPRDRIGREYVVHYDADEGRPMWERLSPEQLELEANMTPLLRELTPKQGEAIRLVHYGQLTGRQAAAVMGVDESTVREHLKAGYARLRKLIEDKYLAPAPNVAD